MLITREQEMGRLLVGLCRLHHIRADQSVEKMGLFRGQCRLLMVLSEADGLTHSQIAEQLGVSAAAVTKVIKRLEEGQYVQRRADPIDQRVSRVYLQPAGRALIEQIHGAFERLDSAMLEGFSEPDLDQLSEVLSRMQANLLRYQP